MHRDQNMHYWDWRQFQKIQLLKPVTKPEIEKLDISKEMGPNLLTQNDPLTSDDPTNPN